MITSSASIISSRSAELRAQKLKSLLLTTQSLKALPLKPGVGIITTYPLTTRVVGAPQMISQQVISIFPWLPLPSVTWRTRGLSITGTLILSSHLFLCLPCLLPLSLCLARWFWLDLMNGRHDHTFSVCVFLLWSGGLRVVRLPTGYPAGQQASME